MKPSDWIEAAIAVCAVLITLVIAISQPFDTLNAIIIVFNMAVGGGLIGNAVRKWRKRPRKEDDTQR